ncbi:cytochrome ubiquinol oxidase subunit I [Jiangella aurantiaca]|uniref:Cytochrome ubiquinol oxidase subunit I n=1 Tax=Jiangella aurantiaca TaxID=2530373 RepID=A0A4R5A3E0_9ACTN|nr:cytochrome ubiquinol oxidase subunit I [Jiangella aurantiaca]TDD66458.1 cytochrome ubiquinol oxidase subunit I [Jiangella aurantiaca]
MDVLELARLQFALTAGAHFLFVALTLGLATVVAVLQTRATVGRSAIHARMTRFWGRLYVINYAMGIVTGLVMEFQLGLSWSGLTHFAGNVVGASLAMETLVAFFVESTFLGLWVFGWDKLNRWAHLAAIWVVTLTAYASAYWILVANGFMQNPVGAAPGGEGLRLTDAAAVLTNPSTLQAFWHVLAGALVTAGFFLAGVSAWHLLRRTPEAEFFGRSLRIGVFVAAPALFASAVTGGRQLQLIRDIQPHKWAEFSDGSSAARVGALLMLTSFAAMFFFSLLNVLLALSRRVIVTARLWHVALIAAIPLPYVAMISGWVFREVGRQPWVVDGLLTTQDAVSDLSPSAIRFSFALFGTAFAVLIAVNTWLLARQARRGPDPVTRGPEPVTQGVLV